MLGRLNPRIAKEGKGRVGVYPKKRSILGGIFARRKPDKFVWLETLKDPVIAKVSNEKLSAVYDPKSRYRIPLLPKHKRAYDSSVEANMFE